MTVNHVDGKVAKVETITEGNALAAARSQNAALAQAQTSFETILERAAAQDPGFRPVGIHPSLKSGHAVASVTLVMGEQLKSVEHSLE